jgi:phage-related minor tail protein
MAEEKAKIIQVDPLAPTEIIPTIELEKELAGIDAHNQNRINKIELVEQKTESVKENESEIQSLKARVKSLEQKNSVLNSELLELNVWLDEEENQLKTNTEDLQEKIYKIKEDNKAVEQNKKALEQKTLYEKCAKEAEDCDKAVKKIEQEKLDIIKNASMPDGFGFSDEGITYNGFAFNKDQLSSSGIYIAALKLAAIGLGEVKTLHFDASFLDKKSLLEIEQWANENDLQLLIERPAFEGGEIEYQLINESK